MKEGQQSVPLEGPCLVNLVVEVHLKFQHVLEGDPLKAPLRLASGLSRSPLDWACGMPAEAPPPATGQSALN